MNHILPEEKVMQTFENGSYILRTKGINGKGHAQYRYWFICKICGIKFRVDNKNCIAEHKCKDQEKQGTITSYFTGIDNTKLIFYKMICKTNISLRAAASYELKKFSRYIFIKGQQSILTQLNPQIRSNIRVPDFNEVIPWESRQTLAKNIISAAKTLKDVTFSNLKPFKYISFCLDGGSINAVPLLDIIIQNPFFTGKPLLIEARSRFDGLRNTYIKIIKSVLLNKVSKYSFIIASFNGDNLAAQKAAFNERSDSILQQNELKNICRGALYFPCVCHVSALGFNDCISGTQLSDIQDDLRSICKMFRAKPIQQYFETICPPFCPTRWTNCFTIAEWLLNNRKSIFELFKEPNKAVKGFMKQNPTFPNIFLNYIPIFYSMLYCYNEFIAALEGDHVPAAFIWPLFQSFKEESTRILSVADTLGINCRIWITDLIDCISKRLASAYGAPLLKFLWYLTPSGRIDGRKEMRENGIEIGSEPIDDMLNELERPSIHIDCDRFKMYLTESITDLNSNKDVLEASFNHITDYEGHSDGEYEEELEEEALGLSETSNGYEELDCTITSIYEYIEKRAREIAESAPQEYCLSIVSYYRQWITDPIEKAWNLDLYRRSAWHYWKEIRVHSKEWTGFSDFALRHLAIVSNSASCERAFWREARQKPANRFQTSDDLLMARVLLSSLD